MRFGAVLAIDSAMAGCCAAVYADGGRSAVSKSVPMVRGQAEQLMPLIEGVMGEAGLEYADLDAVLTTRGPGAFTGLRIGVSAAKSLALALEVPVFGMTNLQALAFECVGAVEGGQDIASIIETKRSDFYIQLFDALGQPQGEAQALPCEEAVKQLRGRNVVCIGDGIERFKVEAQGFEGVYKSGFELPNMGICAKIFAEGAAQSGAFSEGAEPVYLRGPDVGLSKKIQRVIKI